MPFHAQIKASQPIAGQTIATALQDNRVRVVELHDARYYGFEDRFVRRVVYAIAHREVDCVVFSRADADISQLAGAREILAVFVEGYRHDSIRRVKGFFDAVAVVDIDVDVEHTLVES